jgi:hypothetical protein
MLLNFITTEFYFKSFSNKAHRRHFSVEQRTPSGFIGGGPSSNLVAFRRNKISTLNNLKIYMYLHLLGSYHIITKSLSYGLISKAYNILRIDVPVYVFSYSFPYDYSILKLRIEMLESRGLQRNKRNLGSVSNQKN